MYIKQATAWTKNVRTTRAIYWVIVCMHDTIWYDMIVMRFSLLAFERRYEPRRRLLSILIHAGFYSIV